MATYVPPKFTIADVFKSSKKIRDEMTAEAYMHKIFNDAKQKQQEALKKSTDSKSPKDDISKDKEKLKQKQKDKQREKQEKSTPPSSITASHRRTNNVKGKELPIRTRSESSTAPPSPQKHKKPRRKSPSPQPQPNAHQAATNSISRSTSKSRSPSDILSSASQPHYPAMLSHPLFPWGYQGYNPYMAGTTPDVNAGLQYPVTYAGSGVYHPPAAPQVATLLPAQTQTQIQAVQAQEQQDKDAAPAQEKQAAQPSSSSSSSAAEASPSQSVREGKTVASPETASPAGSPGTPAGGGGGGGQSEGGQQITPHVWTTEQDACLVELKKKECTWNSISRTLSISKNDCRSRWGEIKRMGERKREEGEKEEMKKEEKKGGDEDGDGDGAGGSEECRCKRCKEIEKEKNDKGKEKKKEKEKEKEEEKAKEKKQQQENKDADTDNNNDDEKNKKSTQKVDKKKGVTFSEPLILESALKKTNNGSFDLQELLLLNKLVDKFEREKWLRVSSRFYDLTGRRITAVEAQENCSTTTGL